MKKGQFSLDGASTGQTEILEGMRVYSGIDEDTQCFNTVLSKVIILPKDEEDTSKIVKFFAERLEFFTLLRSQFEVRFGLDSVSIKGNV